MRFPGSQRVPSFALGADYTPCGLSPLTLAGLLQGVRLFEPPRSCSEYAGPALREIGRGCGRSPSPNSELVMLLV
jgi:hypothetical protein